METTVQCDGQVGGEIEEWICLLCGYYKSCPCPIPDLSPQCRGVRAGQGEDGAVQAAAGDGGLHGRAGAARTLPRHAAQVSRYGV